MSDLSGEVGSAPAEPALAPAVALDSDVKRRVGWGWITRFTLAFIGTDLLFLAPLLVTLPLKVNALVGIDQAPNSLAFVAGIGGALSIVANPFFGRMSDRTTSRFGMRRPWMLGGLAG